MTTRQKRVLLATANSATWSLMRIEPRWRDWFGLDPGVPALHQLSAFCSRARCPLLCKRHSWTENEMTSRSRIMGCRSLVKIPGWLTIDSRS